MLNKPDISSNRKRLSSHYSNSSSIPVIKSGTKSRAQPYKN